MAVMFERRSSASAIWARRVAVFSAVLLVVSGSGHRYGLVPTVAFFWLLGIVGTLAIIALLLASIGFFRLWEHGDRGGRASTRATLIAIAVLVPFAIGAFRAVTLPRLTDVSTDLGDPPGFFFAQFARAPDMNRVGSITSDQADLQAAAYPALTGRRYTLTVDRTKEIVTTVVRNLGWHIEGTPQEPLDAGRTTIEAAAPSPIFGFVSDVAIRIIDEGETSYVDVRSASRYGSHDLGDNAAKITRFFDELDAEIEALNNPVLR